MTTYKEIFGKPVKVLSSDPTDAQAEGQVWYNSTTGTFKTVLAVGAWSSAAPLSTARYLANGFGSQTAGVYSAGQTPPGTNVANTEEYNGTGWTTATSFPSTATSGGSGGTATAGVVMGGGAPYRSTSFKYDGSSWTATGALPTAADNISACGTGTQTNIIAAIGRTPASGNSGTNTSVTYNGSTFSSGPNLNTARMYGGAAGTGTGTAGLIFGGFIDPSPNAMTNTEEYDGSAWTNAGALNVASSFPSGFGTQTLTVAQVKTPNYGGSEQYNGSTWSALPNTGLTSPGGLYGNAAGTTGNAGWIFGYPSGTGVEYNLSIYSPIAATWASGGNMPTIGANISAFGTQTAAVISGRAEVPGNNFTTILYNGTSWTNNPAGLNTSRISTAEAGTQTAGLIAAGFTPASSPSTATEEFNGSSWTTVASVGTATYNMASGGTQTTAWKGGGSTNSNATEEYDGSSWTAGGNMLAPQYYNTGAGTQTAAMAVGGRRNNSPPANANTEEYDGSSWTAGGNYPTASFGLGASGTQIDALYFGGTDYSTASNSYNGTSWASQPSIATGRQFPGFPTTGTSTSAFIAGGRATGGAATAATEEFTGETFVLGYKTLTSS